MKLGSAPASVKVIFCAWISIVPPPPNPEACASIWPPLLSRSVWQRTRMLLTSVPGNPLGTKSVEASIVLPSNTFTTAASISTWPAPPVNKAATERFDEFWIVIVPRAGSASNGVAAREAGTRGEHHAGRIHEEKVGAGYVDINCSLNGRGAGARNAGKDVLHAWAGEGRRFVGGEAELHEAEK